MSSIVSTEGSLEVLSVFSCTRLVQHAPFPPDPRPPKSAAWPVIQARAHALLIAPTGTGKTLAGFLAILDRLWHEHQAGKLPADALRCVYLSPLRSLGYDIERNLTEPLEAIRSRSGAQGKPDPGREFALAIPRPTVATRMKDKPPHLLITTPESLSILLSQPDWRPIFEHRRADHRRRGSLPGPDQARR